MRLITRYLLRGYIFSLIVVFVGLNCLAVLFDLSSHMSKFFEADLSFIEGIKYYFGKYSAQTHLIMPVSCFLATLWTVLRLSFRSELIAMRASGMSFYSITIPFLVVSWFMGLVVFFSSEIVVPKYGYWAQNLEDASYKPLKAGIKKNHQYYGASGAKWIFYSLDASSVESISKAGGIYVSGTHVEGDEETTWGVKSTDARYLDGVWWMRYPHKSVFDIDGTEIPTENVTEGVPEFVPYYELSDTPKDIFLYICKLDFLDIFDIRYLLAKEKNREKIAEMQYAFWYRFASPWSCVVLTLLGIPIGLGAGRRSILNKMFKDLLLCVGFFAILIALKFFSEVCLIPPLFATWFPIVTFFGIGLYMYRKLT